MVTAESIKQSIAAGLDCAHVEVWRFVWVSSAEATEWRWAWHCDGNLDTPAFLTRSEAFAAAVAAHPAGNHASPSPLNPDTEGRQA